MARIVLPRPPRGARAGLLAMRQKLDGWQKQWRAFLNMALRFTPYLRKRVGRLGLALGSALAYMLLGLLEPWPLKLVLDNVILNQPLPGFLSQFQGDRLLLLNTLVVSIVLIAVVRGVFYYCQQVLSARVGQQVVADVRLDLFSHLQRLSFSFHDRRRTGDLLVRLTSDIGALRQLLVSFPITVASEIFLVVSMTAVMFIMDWQLTLVALGVLPGLAVLLRKYQGPMREAVRKQRKREGYLVNSASEILGAIKVVQGFGRERYEVERFSASNKKSMRSGLKVTRMEAKLRWASDLVVAIMTAAVLSVAVRRVLDGSLSPGDLLVFVAYLTAFTKPLRRTSRIAERSARGTAAGERVLELLETEPAVRDLPGATPAPPFRGAVAYEDVSFAHSRGKEVLSAVALRIEPGERVVIVGPTGAGKSSLVSLLPRFYDPTNGRVCIDGRDVREYTLDSLREQISLVFQEPVLYATTIAENIAYGKPGATLQEIVAAAERAGIHDVIAALPDGYDTTIGERGGTLSGGQRQCVAIARAMIKDAPIVILDEPTTGLDNRSAALVMAALRRLMESRTVIMITHDLRLARDANRVVVLEGGRVVEEGTHAGLLLRDGLYSTLQRLSAGASAP